VAFLSKIKYLTAFSDNSTAALLDSGQNLHPSLFIAIYDSKLTLRTALELGYTRPKLFNANGITAITLSQTYRQTTLNGPFFYDYGSSLSTVPAQDLVCDVSKSKAWWACYTSLRLQFPTFEQNVVTRQPKKSGDVSTSIKLSPLFGSTHTYLEFLLRTLSPRLVPIFHSCLSRRGYSLTNL